MFIVSSSYMPQVAEACKLSEAPLMKIEDVQDRLNVGRSTVYKMVERGQLPAPIRIGKSVRWSQDDVNEFVENQRPSNGQ